MEEVLQKILKFLLIVIIRHELDLDRLLAASSVVSSNVFQVVSVHSVYNSALFWTSCCSFLLHVATNLISVFLVSRQLVLVANLPRGLHFFCGQISSTRVLMVDLFFMEETFRALFEYNIFQRFGTKTTWGTAMCSFCYLWSAEWQVEENSVVIIIHSFQCYEKNVYFETDRFCSEYNWCVIMIDTSSFVSLYFNWIFLTSVVATQS